MREVFLDPIAGQRTAAAVQVAIDSSERGSRVLIRIGSGKWRSLSSKRAGDLAMVLLRAAADASPLPTEGEVTP